MIIGVLVELSNKNIDKIFDYSVPLHMQEYIKVGIRVEVPFGRMSLEGFVLEIKEDTSLESLKEIISIIDDDVILNDELLLLGKEVQRNTLSTLISCYQVMLPKALKAKRGVSVNKKFDIYYKLNNNIDGINFSSKQLEIINLCKEKGFVLRKDLIEISLSSLNTLIKKKVLV